VASLFRTKNKSTRSKRKYHRKWRFKYTDADGRRRTGTGTTSKTETQKIAEALENEQTRIRLGYKPRPKKSDGKHPYEDIAAKYLAWGNTHGGRGGRPWSRIHAHQRERFLEWWKDELGLNLLSDLDGVLPRVDEALQRLKKKRAGKTVESYADGLISFIGWCMEQGYLRENPLRKRTPFDTTPETERRAMTVEEIRRLFEKCAPHRQVLYEVAICTGLRANELRSLSVTDFDVERQGLRLNAAWTKNRKPGFQLLPGGLVLRLARVVKDQVAKRAYDKIRKRMGKRLKMQIPADPLLYVPSHTARDMDKDLSAAGVPKVTEEGKLDFHASRAAYDTLIAEGGANIEDVRRLMRHATVEMQKRYGRARETGLRPLVESVGEKILSPQKCLALVERRATGTDGKDATGSDGNDLDDAEELERTGIRFPQPCFHHLAPTCHQGNWHKRKCTPNTQL